jgi:hypothetical protein
MLISLTRLLVLLRKVPVVGVGSHLGGGHSSALSVWAMALQEEDKGGKANGV